MGEAGRVRYEFEEGVLVFIAEGNYAPEALFHAWHTAMADPACPEIPPILLDASKSLSLGRRHPRDIRAITGFFQRQVAGTPGRRVALVVSGRVQYGIMRIAETLVSLGEAEAKVFFGRPDAMHWLERSSATMGPLR